jgi:hypothetical protein
MKVSRKQLLSMIEEEAERTARLEETSVRNVKEPLSAAELDMLDLLLTRADLYGEVPSGHDADVFGHAIDAVAELYKAAQDDTRNPEQALHPEFAGYQGASKRESY